MKRAILTTALLLALPAAAAAQSDSSLRGLLVTDEGITRLEYSPSFDPTHTTYHVQLSVGVYRGVAVSPTD